MKHLKQIFRTTTLSIALLGAIFITSCNNDDSPTPGPKLTGDKAEFTLNDPGSSGISGKVTFAKVDDESTVITLELSGTTADGDHPAHVHVNTAAETGGIVLDLTNVDGSTGLSETTVSTLNDGTALTYDQLVAFDGYINVHNSPSDLGTLVAQGDIGQNELTGVSTTYDLSAMGESGISGDAKFLERASGETLVMINLTGDAADSDHPAHIHMNTAAEGGGIVVDLTNVQNGGSKTNIAELNDGTAVTYTELIDYDGYINIHTSSSDLGTSVTQGDIGQNALTGVSITYTLDAVGDSGISGDAKFLQRANGETLIMINLTGDATDSDHASHIHMGSTTAPNGIVIDLENVVNGSSKTNVAAFNSATAVTYTELIAYAGYINIHSTGDLGTLSAQGNIGSN